MFKICRTGVLMLKRLLCFIHVLFFKGLLVAVSSLMTQGGDPRIQLLPFTGLNYVHTAPCVVEDLINRASCSGSFITSYSYSAVEKKIQNLHEAADKVLFFDNAMEDIREKIITTLFPGVVEKPLCITTPSTEDACILALLALLQQAQAEVGNGGVGKITSIVLLEGQNVTEKIMALRLEHYGSQAPLGAVVQRGGLLEGVQQDFIQQEVVEVRSNLTGDSVYRVDIQNRIKQLAHKAIIEEGRHVVLCFDHTSAVGLTYISEHFVKELQQQYGSRFYCLIDMSQMRFELEGLKKIIENGWFVLINAAYFFQAPLFAGALLMPFNQAAIFNQSGCSNRFFTGLKDYITKYDVDLRLTELRNFLPDSCNEGLFARWTVGLEEMLRFYALPKKKRDLFIQEWVSQVRHHIVQERSMFLLEDVFCGSEFYIAESALAGVNTILAGVPMFLQDGQWVACSPDVLETVINYLAQDMSSFLPETVSDEDLLLAQERVLVGAVEPLSSQLGVLRLSLGASLVADCLESVDEKKALNDLVESDVKILRKITLVLQYYYDIVQKTAMRFKIKKEK